MSEWWEKPYPGGPMVDVPGFPRPLYPPDANTQGKQPSPDGPDVIAYKRTVSRAGRWEWGTFDDSYSNSFSHGKEGGNVGESGIAGIQRQGNLDPTGWIGERTFNLLRSIRVPDGLIHAGEMAMDAYAQHLIAEAWEQFHGGHDSAPAGSSARARINQAGLWIGYKESPPNSNITEFGEWYGMDGQPWCAMFVAFCDAHSGQPAPATFAKGARYAYVPYMVEDARNGDNGLQITTAPAPGDLVMFDWENNGVWDHAGLFYSMVAGSSSQFLTIEGNTSIDNNSNGGEVMKRTRAKGTGVLFARVREP